ncbi:hypothetical protein BFR40_01725 [Brochothrix thermosphacta]|uniref:hypothetical protein n=1 Tax=Brochothrix thermosphacta TaxID=2756 RepID=UPI00083F5956|nr:hypothetical protein [Brochothrix thermosphacta]ODJ53359.1 hypothetical protein BFR40_01725 [Brochothrix thermosphacta]
MDTIIRLVLIAAIIAFQTFSGRIGNKYLGSILPIIFIGFIIYSFVIVQLNFSFKDLFMSFLGLTVLASMYAGGVEAKKKKLKKELDKMKAKDISAR